MIKEEREKKMKKIEKSSHQWWKSVILLEVLVFPFSTATILIHFEQEREVSHDSGNEEKISKKFSL